MSKYPEDIRKVATAIADDWCMPECEGPLSMAIAEAILAERERAAEEVERLKRNMRDQFDALCAMRNDLNEMLPIQSIEADLMKGPETSVFCEAVVNAVKAHIAKIGASA